MKRHDLKARTYKQTATGDCSCQRWQVTRFRRDGDTDETMRRSVEADHELHAKRAR